MFVLLTLLAGCGTDKPATGNSLADTTHSDRDTQANPPASPVTPAIPAPAPPPPNTAPSISDIPALDALEGETFYLMPGAEDQDGDLLQFQVQGLPHWASFNADTGAISGTPPTGSAGVYGEILITVSDGQAADTTAPFRIRVARSTPVPTPAPAPMPASQPSPPKPVQPAIPANTPVAQPTNPPSTPDPVVRKYRPGHYIAMNRYDDHPAIINAVKPGVVGMQIRYTWASLEPSFNQYDFSNIRADLALLAAQGMQLVIFVEDKSFTAEIPTPPYLRNHTLANRHNGYTSMRWQPYVVTRLNLLLEALGKEFDDHPNVEGIALQESALSLDDAPLEANGYTPEKYRDALLSNLRAAARHFPSSQVFWYMNFLQGKQDYLRDIAFAVAPLGVAVGGPDVLPDDIYLQTHTYPMYEEFKGKMTLFNSMQYNSYNHRHKHSSYPTKYWTMAELFRFARDRLHVNYLFWNRKAWKDPEDSYSWQQALPVINSNPSFNR